MTLADVRRFALSLPGVTESPHFDYTSFRIRGKIIATAPPGGAHLHVFVTGEARDLALAAEPGFVHKLLWGGKVSGLRLELAHADSVVVNELVRDAWLRRAPKKLTDLSSPGATRRRPRSKPRG